MKVKFNKAIKTAKTIATIRKRLVAISLVLAVTMVICCHSGNMDEQVQASGTTKKTVKVTLSSAKASSNAITVKWKLSNAKKSDIKSAQIKVSTKKNMNGAKTYKLNKASAKKMSYKFTVKSGKISKGETYYFKIRLKVKNKWTSWSGVKSAKVKKKSDDENDLSKYKCPHTLAAGETSAIVDANGIIIDVHTCTINSDSNIYYAYNNSGTHELFMIYQMKWDAKQKKGVIATGEIDYSKVSLSFDDGKSGELWDWLGHDFCGFDGYIYSVPNYKNALADVYIDANNHGTISKQCCIIQEETVPHDTDGSYKVAVYYNGVYLASQTRTKKACINKAIKLFQDYGGEEYMEKRLPELEEVYKTKAVYPMVIDNWQCSIFNYYGCQNGTRLEAILIRYYFGNKTAAVDDPKLLPQSDYADYIDKATGFIAPRYKQFGSTCFLWQHVYLKYYDEESKIWGPTSCHSTGSYCESEDGTRWTSSDFSTSYNGHESIKKNMPYLDYEAVIYK